MYFSKTWQKIETNKSFAGYAFYSKCYLQISFDNTKTTHLHGQKTHNDTNLAARYLKILSASTGDDKICTILPEPFNQ